MSHLSIKSTVGQLTYKEAIGHYKRELLVCAIGAITLLAGLIGHFTGMNVIAIGLTTVGSIPFFITALILGGRKWVDKELWPEMLRKGELVDDSDLEDDGMDWDCRFLIGVREGAI